MLGACIAPVALTPVIDTLGDTIPYLAEPYIPVPKRASLMS